MAAPTFVACSDTIDSDLAGAASVTVTLPSHQANDILIVSCLNDGGGTMTTATSGWASIVGIDSTDNARWFWKRATSGAETSPVIEAASTDVFVTAYCIRGCETSGNPWNTFNTVDALATATAEVTAPEITTTVAECLVCTMSVINDDTALDVAPPPGGWTLPSPGGNYFTAAGTDARMVVCWQEQASAGTNAANSVCTITTAETWATLKIAFKPPGGGPTPVVKDVIGCGVVPFTR